MTGAMVVLAALVVSVATMVSAYQFGAYRARWLARSAVLRQATAEYRRETATPPTPRAVVADLIERLARASVRVHLDGGEGRGWLLRDVQHAWDRELRRAIERSDRIAVERETAE